MTDRLPPDLPVTMTWEELENLPEEIAGEVELWQGRVVWVPRDPAEHQIYSIELQSALQRCAREDPSGGCVRASTETSIFFSLPDKSDFITPDFLVYPCPTEDCQDLTATKVVIAGEVLLPWLTRHDIEARKARYARAGIPWYWEVVLGRDPRRIARVRIYGLEVGHVRLPDGVAPLRPANYITVGEWEPTSTDGIIFDHPFPIRIPWAELEF